MHFCHQNIFAKWGLLCVATIRRHWKQRWAARPRWAGTNRDSPITMLQIDSGRVECHTWRTHVISKYKLPQQICLFFFQTYMCGIENRRVPSWAKTLLASGQHKDTHSSEFSEPYFLHSCFSVPWRHCDHVFPSKLAFNFCGGKAKTKQQPTHTE